MEIDLYLVREILRVIAQNPANSMNYVEDCQIDISEYDCYTDRPENPLRFHIDWVCEAGFTVFDILDISCKSHRGIIRLSESGGELLTALEGATLSKRYQAPQE